MAFQKLINELKRIIILALLGIQSAALANFDCNGKSFHCVNSTHFMICVDLGGGVSTTVDDFVIPCPPTTVCEINNRFECEFIAPTTPAPFSRTSEVTNELDTSATTIPWEVVVTTDVPPDNASEAHYSDIKNFTVNFTTLPENTVSVSTEAYIFTDSPIIPIISTGPDTNIMNKVELATVTEFIPNVTTESIIAKLDVSSISPLNYTSSPQYLDTKTNTTVDLTNVTDDSVSVTTEAVFTTKGIISTSDTNYINTLSLTSLPESYVNIATDTVSTKKDIHNSETGTSTTESNVASLYNTVSVTTIPESNVNVTTNAVIETNETINNETDTSTTESAFIKDLNNFNTVRTTTLPEINSTVNTLTTVTIKDVIDNEIGNNTTATNLNTVSLTTIPESIVSFTTESGTGNKDNNISERGINADASTIFTDSPNLNTVSLTTLPHPTISATTDGIITMNINHNETNATEGTILINPNILNIESVTTVPDHNTTVPTGGTITTNIINNEISTDTTESTTVPDILNFMTFGLTKLPDFTLNLTAEAFIAPKDIMNNESIINTTEKNMGLDSNPVSFTTLHESTVIITTEAIFTTKDIITNAKDIESTKVPDKQNMDSVTLTTIPDISVNIITEPVLTTNDITNNETALRTIESTFTSDLNIPESNIASEAAIPTYYTLNETTTNTSERNVESSDLNKFNTVSIKNITKPTITVTTEITTTANDVTNYEGKTEAAVTGPDSTNMGLVTSIKATEIKSPASTGTVAESEAAVTYKSTIMKDTIGNTVVPTTELRSFAIMTQPVEKTNNATESSDTADSDRVLTGDSKINENIMATTATYIAVTNKTVLSTVTADNITESSAATSIEPVITENMNLTGRLVTIEPKSITPSYQTDTTGSVNNVIRATVSTINETLYTTEPTIEATNKHKTYILSKESTVADKKLFNNKVTSANTENHFELTTDSTKLISTATNSRTESLLDGEHNVNPSNKNKTVDSITTNVEVIYATIEASVTQVMLSDGVNLTDTEKPTKSFETVTEISNTVNEPDISNSGQYLEFSQTASTDTYSAPTTIIIPTSLHESSVKTTQYGIGSKRAPSANDMEPFGTTANTESPITSTNSDILITIEPDLPVSTIVTTTTKAGDSTLTSSDAPLQLVTTSYATDITVAPLEDITIGASKTTFLSTGDNSVFVSNKTSTLTKQSGITKATGLSTTNPNLSLNYAIEQTQESNVFTKNEFMFFSKSSITDSNATNRKETATTETATDVTLPTNDGKTTTSVEKNIGTVSLIDKLSTINNNVKGFDFVTINLRDTTIVTTEPYAIDQHSSSTQYTGNKKVSVGTQEPINDTHIDIISRSSIQTSSTTIFNVPVTPNNNLEDNLLNSSAQRKKDKSSPSVLSTESELLSTSALITSDNRIPLITASPHFSTSATFKIQNDNATGETAGLSAATKSFTPNISIDSPITFSSMNEATSTIELDSLFTVTPTDDYLYEQQELDVVISTKTPNASDFSDKQNNGKTSLLEENLPTQNTNVVTPIIKTSMAINKTLQNVTYTEAPPTLKITFTETSFSATPIELTLAPDRTKVSEGSVNLVEKSSTVIEDTLKPTAAQSIKNDASAYILQKSDFSIMNSTPEFKSNISYTVGLSDVLIKMETNKEIVKPIDQATIGDPHFGYTQPTTKTPNEITPLRGLAKNTSQESVLQKNVTIPAIQLKTTKQPTTENTSKITVSKSDVDKYSKQEQTNIIAHESSTVSDKLRSTDSDANNKPVKNAEPVKTTLESSLSPTLDVPVLPTTTKKFSLPTGFDKSSTILIGETNIPTGVEAITEALQSRSKLTNLHTKTINSSIDNDKSEDDRRKLDFTKATIINTDSFSEDVRMHSKLEQEKIYSLNSESESSHSSDKGITTKNETTSTIELITHVTEKDVNDQINKHTLPLAVVTERATLKTSTKANTNVNEQITPLFETLFDCRNRQRGRYSDKHDCRKFYICIGRLQPIVGLCPINTVFNEIRTQCTKNLSYCIRENEFKCTVEGRFIDFLSDANYYICVKSKQNGFIRFKFQCQKGYHLNKTSIRCIENIEVSSQFSSLKDSVSVSEKPSKESVSATEIQSKESVSATEKQSKESVSSTEKLSKKDKSISKKDKDSFECEKEGKFAHPDDGRKYYVCTLNRKSEYQRKIKKCHSDEVFNQEKRKCVDADDDDADG